MYIRRLLNNHTDNHSFVRSFDLSFFCVWSNFNKLRTRDQWPVLSASCKNVQVQNSSADKVEINGQLHFLT